jgi:hypothetical protein
MLSHCPICKKVIKPKVNRRSNGFFVPMHKDKTGGNCRGWGRAVNVKRKKLFSWFR